MGMQLTEENYYSDIANYEYMSVSQFKDFNGTYGRVACEEAALAKLKGEYAQASSTALMVGSYVDRYFEGTLDAFKSEHTEMFKKDGNLKAEYVKADALIQRAGRTLYEIYVRGKAGHNDRRTVWNTLENQNGQLYSGSCDCGP